MQKLLVTKISLKINKKHFTRNLILNTVMIITVVFFSEILDRQFLNGPLFSLV